MDRGAAAAFLRHWHDIPAIATAHVALDACPEDDAAATLAAVDTLLADTDWVDETIAGCVAAARADPAFQPPFPTLGEGVQDGLLLIDHPRVVVTLVVIPHVRLGARKVAAGGDGMIGFSGTISRYRVLRGGGARIGWWRCARIADAFDAREAEPCWPDGAQRLADGDWLLVDGAAQGFVVEAAQGDIVLLHATLHVGRAPLRTEHDAVSLGYAAASATDPAASHRQMMATLLRILRRADAAPALAALAAMAEDPAFFVRWHAARELMALDPAAARPVLRRMTDDPRADIRQAAAAALARYGPCPA